MDTFWIASAFALTLIAAVLILIGSWIVQGWWERRGSRRVQPQVPRIQCPACDRPGYYMPIPAEWGRGGFVDHGDGVNPTGPVGCELTPSQVRGLLERGEVGIG